MKWISCSIDVRTLKPTDLSMPGATPMQHARTALMDRSATNGAHAGAGHILQAKAAVGMSARKVQTCGRSIQHGAGAVKLLGYRVCCGGSASCKRLQDSSSYPSAELLLQIESKMRYYPACISEDCLFTCPFVGLRHGQFQCSVHDGQMPPCDCHGSMDALRSLRRLAA